MSWRCGMISLALLITPSLVAAAEVSSRPVLRNTPVEFLQNPLVNLVSAPDRSLRPEQRKTQRNANVTVVPNGNSAPNAAETKPKARPGFFKSLRLGGRKSKSSPAKGALCGVPGIEGKRISAVPGRINGCGIPEPVSVTAIDGVALSQAATIDCTTAKALHSWVKNGAKPVVGRKGGGIKSLHVVAHYACRTRNNRRGAKISEHGRGRAIDIAGISLENGQSLSVLKDWRSSNASTMRGLHKAACGPFGTVLGPNSDRFHQDHFHFDTARYRSGPYCR
ncbi:MAG: extensin family protein [Litoreibacter sp.]